MDIKKALLVKLLVNIRITNNHSLPQSQQLTQVTYIKEEEIRMSINLLYVEDTSEKLWCILRYHIIKTLCVNCFVNLKIE